jgi:hypothetical protein
MMIAGPGNLIGEEDAINSTTYTSTIICKSMKGSLLEIDIDEFDRKLKPVDETWCMIQ